MFDTCQTISAGPKCSEVAEKIVQLFGWRQTYNVEKLQRSVPSRATTKISITKSSPKGSVIDKGPESWVSVHNLQTQGGGILDPDDKLSDVVDDREQILASFEDGDGSHHHAGGDGASGSSVGTGSPDIFHDSDKFGSAYSRTDIEVTGEQIASGAPGALQVRRGSEPALNQLPVGPPSPPDPTKRWSAAPIILEPPTLGYIAPDWGSDSREEDEEPGFRRIARDGSNRLSMQFLGDGAGYRWAEAAERAANSRSVVSTSLPREAKRKEPLGQANSSSSPVPMLSQASSNGELIVIRNEPGPLGIHVVPDYDRLGKDRGLLVQGIEPGGRIDRDGRLAIFDRIVEINGQSLINMPFQRVQEMFKLSLTSPELRLKVVKNSGLDSLRKPPPPVYPKLPEDKENVSMVECEQKQSTNTKVATVSPTKKVPAIAKKSLQIANTRKIGRKHEIELIKGPHGLGFSITTRDNPAGGNCPIYIKNIIPKGAAIEDGRLKIGDRLLEVNGVEMTGKSQAEAVAVLRNAPLGSKVRIVVSRQEEVTDNSGNSNSSSNTNSLPRVIDVEPHTEKEADTSMESTSSAVAVDVPPNIPPLPQSHLQALQNRTPDKGSVAKIVSQFQEATNSPNPPEKYDENMVFPWKHREILTFNIPVHDTEKAGLGISVKGKTSGNQDLGIFIKTVINGGAASRDKRLRINDQLLNVNGISLLQQTNGDAMETLRKAMLHTEGPVPGNITLTIARRAPSPGPNRNGSNRNSDSSLLETSSNGQDVYNSNETEPSSTDHSGASGSSTNTVIHNIHNSLDRQPSQSISPVTTWNPVVDRIMSGNNKHQLRNESYYKATHDTWSSSMLGNSNNSYGNLTTVNMTTAEPILIEDEYGSRVLTHQNSSSRINIHMTNKLNGIIPENRSDHEPDGKASLTSSNFDNKSSAESSSQTTIQGTDATYASQLSLENPQGFTRDAFGRQSMSEKRHATLDAKNTDTYQRSKKLREERNKMKENADKLGQLGPSLGMKKSSSLESLQTMVQEIQMQEECDPAYSYRGPSGALKVIRGRGCEESFRNAVDKHIVDPNHRSEISAKKHWLLDPPIENEVEVDGFNNVRGAPRQSSLNAALDAKIKPGKKKSSILKGIGSMFRFGKHRKVDFPTTEQQHYHSNNEFDSKSNQSSHQQSNGDANQNQEPSDNQSNHSDRTQDSSSNQQQQSQQSNQHLQNNSHHHPQQQQQQQKDEHKEHQQQQRESQHQREQQQKEQKSEEQQRLEYQREHQRRDHHREQQHFYQRHGFTRRHAEQVQVIPENSVIPPVKFRGSGTSESQRRAERKLQEQRLAQRHTYYDEREMYDQRQHRHEPNSPYGDYGRPGSRSGITDSVPFTHYVNYMELQNHISRKQHQYHSQRQTRADNQLRPASNFYEYESIQSLLNNKSVRTAVSPQQHQQQQQHSHQQEYSDVNSNSLSRQQPPPTRHPSGRSHQHRGPFVTHVNIGEHNQPNGTKV